MVNIIHRVGIRGSSQDVYTALTTNEGLSRWWTSDTSGAGDVGSIINFRFNDTVVQFKVFDLQPGKLVWWQHSGDVPEAWMATEVLFELEACENQTYVNFSHQNWKKPSKFMAHCSTKWAVFLLSLKQAVESGRGRPFPDDLHIDHDES